ncbi:hypothetical protein OF83DRAFT_1242929 [Amylostereum chailletii]|nr:hypothetical protein OF83DRAFT_1242929 [Amylostereum chailletii]
MALPSGESSSSKWQSIRPWNHRLSLSVREITSVSATFILSSLSSHTNLSLILDGDDDDDGEDNTSPTSNSPQIISESLAKGLSVKVNTVAWQRVLARIDDEADEAVIIIYGLLPGKQYDIEFAIVPGEERVKGQIVTAEHKGRDRTRSGTDGMDIPEVILSSAPSSPRDDTSPSPPSSSPPSTPGTPSHTHQTFEEYLASLRNTLAHLQTEHDTLLTNLKSARRDSQKSQSALRSDIASLKRSSQKHSTGDVRMRQKVRALEEAAKQAAKGREDVDAECNIIAAEQELTEQEHAVQQKRWQEVSELAERERRKREGAEETATFRVQGVKADLTSVEAKLEKLQARREKLEGRSSSEDEREGEGSSSDPEHKFHYGGIVGELDARLQEIRLERKRIEQDPYGYVATTNGSTDGQSVADSLSDNVDPPIRTPHTNSHHLRNHNSLPFAPHHGRGKRHGPFNPQHGSQAHSHSHSHSHSIPHLQQRGFPPFTPPAGRVMPIVQRPPGPHNITRGQQHMSGNRPPTIRRKSSPPPPVGSTLSSLAPPFEPAGVRGRAPAWKGSA